MNYALYIYFAIISLVAIIFTAGDKWLAKHEKRRVPEKRLFLIAILGGSLAMYCTMCVIRHKTKHKRFMIGLPLIMLLQIVIPVCLIILAHI
ncbi:MAG: DUF1294 domain-containing protein [Clostridia bacterium]|nr:DUF1294 domain-containing protein [Clostridia bacterium]